ncbi:MAG: hypothetical protein ACTHKV_06605, partial [Flavipsychrobacter sp.]
KHFKNGISFAYSPHFISSIFQEFRIAFANFGSSKKPNGGLKWCAMEELIDFSQGDIVLVHDQVGGYLIATDIEGRNLGIKGNITRADRGPGSGPGYILDNFTTPDGKLIKKNSFVWVKERKPGAPNVTVQYADKKMISIPADKVYDINIAAAQMAGDTKPKTVQ